MIACNGDSKISKQFKQYAFNGKIMGTTYNVSLVFERSQSDVFVDELHGEVKSVLDLIDTSMSTYKKQSDVSRFNQLSVGESIDISKETASVLALSQEIHKKTEGYFDPTVGPLVNLWGFGPSALSPGLPSQRSLLEAKDSVGIDKLELLGGKLTKRAEVELDFSAIAKGYAADQVASRLLGLGVTNLMVEIGGEVVAKGVNSRGTKWVLGIEKPEKSSRSVYTAVGISGVAMATSGDYRNYRMIEGQEYSHTIDPILAKPVKTKLASVTVIADTCAEADALATALMAMGDQRAIEYADEHQLRAYFIVRHKDEFVSRSSERFKQYLL